MHILRLHCLDQPGIVAAVATSLRDCGCNIEESAQFHDRHSEQFFMRVVFSTEPATDASCFMGRFGTLADQFEMTWDVMSVDDPVKTVIMVSKEDHCLNDFLYRWRTSHLNIDIAAVVSNHDMARRQVEERGLAFHHLPVTKETKAQQERALSHIIENTKAELIVLARYMQVLSSDMCAQYAGRIINIHHSFLPGFKGGRPYHQAHTRGVKIIGATAHFVTPDLDEGPIIEQETARIDHSYDPDKMKRYGRDVESKVLARAVELYTERRIFLHKGRTVIL